MRNPLSYCVLLSFLCLALTSCKRPAPNPVPLDQERFITVYIALLEQAETLRSGQAGQSFEAGRDSIFRRYGTNDKEFQATIDSYKASPEKWKLFFEEVTKRVEREAKNEIGRNAQ